MRAMGVVVLGALAAATLVAATAGIAASGDRGADERKAGKAAQKAEDERVRREGKEAARLAKERKAEDLRLEKKGKAEADRREKERRAAAKRGGQERTGAAPAVDGSGVSPGSAPLRLLQSQAEVAARSAGCRTCHLETDEPTMHETTTVHLGCADCHGGDPAIGLSGASVAGSVEYEGTKRKAHVQPRFADRWKGARNPERTYTLLNQESLEFVRFVNPGDLRVAGTTCGQAGCHVQQVRDVRSSMMAHGAMLWGAALYNNGAIPSKHARYGEAYDEQGRPARLQTIPPPTEDETRRLGILPYLDPLPRWEVTQPGNVLRVFEQGGVKKPELGIPDPFELPGDPEVKLSNRGFGTNLRTDPVFLGLQKTRLLDPTLWFLGTNDHPGDYRSSGCTSCHVLYANDRSPVHSGAWAGHGNRGTSSSRDPTIPKDEPGHPIRHAFTRAIPSSQCIVCHVHPGTTVTNSYLGTMWWDNETDGEHMYPQGSLHRTARDIARIQTKNPEGAAVRGLWSDPEFLAATGTPEFNARLEHVQFADFHGHGWVFRNVYKTGRTGELLDVEGNAVAANDPQRFQKAVHLKDIHLERGMHCTDCHFAQDSHGNGKLYGEVRNAVEIGCADCHGTATAYATLVTSGPAALGGRDLRLLRSPGGRRFEWRGARLYQRSSVAAGVEWEVVQTKDTVTPGSAHFSERSRAAKLLRKDGGIGEHRGEGEAGRAAAAAELAHPSERMTCFACHTSWTTSCFGCHLPMTANEKRPTLHNEGETLRNWTSYNFQTLRDDVYMLGVDGTVTGNKVAPVRSTCAVLVGSQDQSRQWLYAQQQTISAEGFSGQAFSTFVPHTVRGKETKTCSDCHVSSRNDNNALLAQLLVQGTNFYNFIGRYAFVALGKGGFEAVAVTERSEPQAVIGSRLHGLAYPEEHARHEWRHRLLEEAYHHPPDDVGAIGKGAEVLSVQLRGEYVYAATGRGGLRVFDVANLDNKGFSERMLSAPVSPLGQRLYVRTRYATAVAAPATTALDPLRQRFPENQEQPMSAVYGYIYVTDREEGLILVGAATLLDGDPTNNFLERALTFNPDRVLDGAVNLAIAGNHAYVAAARGLVVVDIADPLRPRVVAVVGAPRVVAPRAVAVQFRYAFVTDSQGLKVIDVTDPLRPGNTSYAPVPEAGGLYVVRNYAYVAAGKKGLAIVDVTRPESPRVDEWFDAEGEMTDVRDVKTGMTNNGLFAYVADGEHGLRVLQLVTAGETPGYGGFAPRPQPRLIATFHTHEPALAISEGLDRDRGVDESGNQLSVFNRIGARPFNRQEMERLYLRGGRVYTVTDDPPGVVFPEGTTAVLPEPVRGTR